MSSDVKIYDWTGLGMEEFDGPERIGLYVRASDYAALETERDALRAELARWERSWRDVHEPALQEAHAYIQELRAAERDVERMEWLESAWGGYSGRDGGFHLSVYMPRDAETLREMIDTAMKGEQQ